MYIFLFNRSCAEEHEAGGGAYMYGNFARSLLLSYCDECQKTAF